MKLPSTRLPLCKRQHHKQKQAETSGSCVLGEYHMNLELVLNFLKYLQMHKATEYKLLLLFY